MNKFEGWWKEIQEADRNCMHTFQLKLKGIKQKIKTWNQEVFGNIMKEKHQLIQKMEMIQQKIIKQGREEQLIEEEGRILNQLEERRK